MEIRYAGGPRCQNRTMRAQKNRLLDAVGDKNDGLFTLPPDAHHREIHPFVCERVEGPEWLVHQDQLGIADERAGDRHTLLHAARELIRILVVQPANPTSASRSRPRSIACARGVRRISAGNITLSTILRHFSGSGC